MRLLLPFIACLMLMITSLTTVAHATEAPERHLTTIEIEGWHAPGDADEVPADPDKNYPHHHSTCHGHDLAAPVKAPAAPLAHGGTPLAWRMPSAELAARVADTPLRPPIA